MSTSTFGLVMLIAVFAGIGLVGLYNRRKVETFYDHLRTAGFALAPCPVAAPFTYSDMTQSDSYRGELSPGVPIHLILGRRRGTSVVVNGASVVSMEEYISVFLPPPLAARLDEGWGWRWQPDLEARGARPMRVVRPPEGGILMTWRSEHDKPTLLARLAAVRQGLSG